MRNRTKKEQSMIRELAGVFIIVAALAGWYITKSLVGTGIAVGVGIVAMILVIGWRSARFKNRMQQSGIAEIDQMTGRQFEEYVGTLFQHQGYKVSYTPTTGDFGAVVLILHKGKRNDCGPSKALQESSWRKSGAGGYSVYQHV